MTVSDAQIAAAFRAGYDRLVERGPAPLDWDEIVGNQPVLATASVQGSGWRRRLTPVTAIGAGVLVIVVAIGSIALLAPFGESPSPTSPSDGISPPLDEPFATTTTLVDSTTTTTRRTTTTSTSLVGRIPDVVAGGSAPWATGPLSQDEVPAVLVEAWNVSPNRSWCSALAPADTAALGPDAVPRTADFSGDWAVAWDNPSGPGMTGSSQPCADCGRSAFGIAGVSLRATGEEPYRWPSVVEFDDGSVAGWGNEGDEPDGAFIDPVTGEQVTPRKLSYMVVAGEGCMYNVWSNRGEEHLLEFIDQLRFVENLRSEPGGPPRLTSQQAFQVVFAFDPATGNPAVLADALAVAGTHPGLGLPILIEHGSPEVREVVFEALGGPSAWAVPTLVAMQAYGMPSGTYEAQQPWPSSIANDIDTALTEAATASYGSLGEMMVELNRLMVTSEVEACVTECDWGAVWYAVPKAVTNPIGTMRDSLFEGSIWVISDTGEGSEYPITVQLSPEGWVPTEGFLAAP